MTTIIIAIIDRDLESYIKYLEKRYGNCPKQFAIHTCYAQIQTNWDLPLAVANETQRRFITIVLRSPYGKWIPQY